MNQQIFVVSNRLALFFVLTVTRITLIYNNQQVSICLRYCNREMEANEVFTGFYATSNTDAKSLMALLKDALTRYGLDIANLRGQAYDGGANFSGCKNGLQKLVREENPKAVYSYCAGHQVNLMIQDACGELQIVGHVMSTINSFVNFIRNSPKRLSFFWEVIK